jgi:hypothetical protein
MFERESRRVEATSSPELCTTSDVATAGVWVWVLQLVDRQSINSRYDGRLAWKVQAARALGFPGWRRPGFFGGQGLEPGAAGTDFFLGLSVTEEG